MSVVSLPSSHRSSTPRLPPADRRETSWLEAAPFRAHVEHLLAASDLSLAELAALSRVSMRLLRRLVQPSRGRPLRRIDPLSARRLFAVTALQACLVRSTQVDAGGARVRLEILTARGRSTSSLVRATGMPGVELSRLRTGALAVVSQLVDLRLAATLAELEGWPDDLDDTTSTVDCRMPATVVAGSARVVDDRPDPAVAA